MSCAHCKGSGFCQHATIAYEDRKCWWWCSKCGNSQHHKQYSYIIDPVPTNDDIGRLKYPVCAACGGKGY